MQHRTPARPRCDRFVTPFHNSQVWNIVQLSYLRLTDTVSLRCERWNLRHARGGGGPMTRSRSFQTLVFAVVVVAAALGLGRESHAGIITAGSGFNSSHANSPVAGAHAGYNWQSGFAVFGFETDVSGMNLHSSMEGTLTSPFGIVGPPIPVTATSATIDWYGTARGRFGVTSGPFLFYGTGGLAYGNVDLSSTIKSSFGAPLNSEVSALKTGWVGGGGIEFIYSPNVVFTLGYQYVNLGTLSLAATMPTGGPILIQNASAQAHFQTILAGFSWRFAPSGPASWDGGYAGIQVGGAWGLPTSATYIAQ
jgi:outer membrane immunogenic protein